MDFDNLLHQNKPETPIFKASETLSFTNVIQFSVFVSGKLRSDTRFVLKLCLLPGNSVWPFMIRSHFRSLFSWSCDGRSCYNKCIVHHTKFCPVSLLLISCRALGSLDTSSGGTLVVLFDGGFTGREYRLPFILRWSGLEWTEWVFGLSAEATTKDSSRLPYG